MSNGDVFTSPDYTGTPSWSYIGRLPYTPSCAVVNGVGVTVGSVGTAVAGNPNMCLASYIDPVALTITPITGMPVCNMMVAYNEFIVVGLRADPASGITTGSSIVWFSDLPANISDLPGISWTLAQGNGVGVVGVGTAEPASGLFTQKDTLVVSKQGGEWWTMTGIPTGPPVIRRMDVGLDFKAVGGAVRQSNIWYPNGRDIGTFTGSRIDVSELPDLGDLGGTSSAYTYGTFNGIASLAQADEFMLTGTGRSTVGNKVPWVFIRHGMSGAGTAPGWSRHVLNYLGAGASYVDSSHVPLAVGDSMIWLFLQARPNLPVDVFQFDIRQEIPYERPGAAFPAGNPKALYADMGTGEIVTSVFSIPEWWAPDGHLAHVTEVFVDLDYDAAAWQNAVASGVDPSALVGFNVSVDSLNHVNRDSARTSQPLPWAPAHITRPVPVSNTNMMRTRASFRVGDQGPGSGFRINLLQMRGIQVFRVLATVELDISAPR